MGHSFGRYKRGDYWRECDVCGFDYLRSTMKKRWDGAIVCKKDYDPLPRSKQQKTLPRNSTFKKD